jgi:hypothetical protein
MRYDLDKCTQVHDIIGSINDGDIIACNYELAVAMKKPQAFTCNDCYCAKAHRVKGYVGLFTYLCAVSRCTQTNMYFVCPREAMEEL